LKQIFSRLHQIYKILHRYPEEEAKKRKFSPHRGENYFFVKLFHCVARDVSPRVSLFSLFFIFGGASLDVNNVKVAANDWNNHQTTV
jgi:hypothetical protein